MKCKRPSCNNEARDNSYKGHVPLYCSKQCKNIDHVFLYRRKQKLLFINYLGGKCMRCEYNKSQNALHFHHRDPSQKEFALSKACKMNFDKVKLELDKCDLLCANCHAEVHEVFTS